MKDFPFRVLWNVDPIPGDTSSNASFVWAERQIAKCNQDHNCLSSTQASPLPSRVLDVSLRNAENSIRLVITTNQRERYVCLSHCWGEGASVTKTTRQNLKAHTKGIAIDKLPKTFQDAVDITRRLGIDYLRIDSLCIIQNSEGDWEKEASRMADIYEGAYLTVAATSSMNSLEGCYRSYPSPIREKGFLYTTKTGLSSTVYCRPVYRHFGLDVAVPNSDETFDDFPLLDRGWVFQERFLSPRVLHYCNAELVFECRNGARCQCNHERSDHGFKGDLMRLFAEGPGLEAFQRTKGWWAVVSRYSRLKLTYDKDILTALSGISRRVGAKQPTDDYVAGIWKNTLPYGLLWYVDSRTLRLNEGSRVVFKRADTPWEPSWSWASVIAPIDWVLPNDRGNEESLVRIHAISCEVSEVDAYGRTYGGVLSITGSILTSNLYWRAWPSMSHSTEPHHYDLEFSAFRTEISNSFLNTSASFYPDYPFYANTTATCWTVQWLWVTPNTILVLKPLEEPGVFERIGLLRVLIMSDRAREEINEAREKSTLMTVKII